MRKSIAVFDVMFGGACLLVSGWVLLLLPGSIPRYSEEPEDVYLLAGWFMILMLAGLVSACTGTAIWSRKEFKWARHPVFAWALLGCSLLLGILGTIGLLPWVVGPELGMLLVPASALLWSWRLLRKECQKA